MSGTIARRDFEIYAKGVKRLEELEKEINFLNVDKRFPTEAASIRSKLKHVSEIPQIEYELKLLKDKISGKMRKPVKRKVVKNNFATEAKINELKKEIERKIAQSKKFAPLSKEVLKLKLEISEMEKKIRSYEAEKGRKEQVLNDINIGVDRVFNDTFNLSLNEIKAKLSKEVENKEAEVQKELQKDLERREEVFNEKYDQLEKQFQDSYNQKVKSQLKKEVENKFAEMVNSELAKKINASEKELNVLKRNLRSEYNSKENILNQHFEKAINEEKKRQKELFNDRILAQKIKLHKKLDLEIGKEVLRIKQNEAGKQHELGQKLSAFSKLREKLMESFRKKKENLENKEEAIIKAKIRDLETQKQESMKRIELRQASLDQEKKKLEVLKENMLSKAKGEFEREKKIALERIADKQKELVAEKLKMATLKNKIILKSKKDIEAEKEEFEEEKRKEEEKILRQEAALKKRAEVIKAKLQQEFEEKLKGAIKIKEQELKAKNIALEKEIQQKVKMFYK